MTAMPTHLQQLREKLKCSFCTREFQNGFFTKCAVCENILLCQDCFGAGVRLPGHDSTHPYRVSDCLEYPIYAKDWSTREELVLLDGKFWVILINSRSNFKVIVSLAIDKFGVGNWRVISEKFLPDKTTKQIEDHYWELYMGIYGYCLPQKCLVDNVLTDTETLFPIPPQLDSNGDEAIDPKDHFHIPVYHGHQRGEIVQRDDGKESVPRTGTKNDARERVANLPGSDLPGYMPLREDFEIEYENDAEVPLADMEFYPDEHPNETALKLQVLRIYNTKLAERDRRKRFAIDRGLIDIKLQQLVRVFHSKFLLYYLPEK
jgi:transcriptional adapter 2-alpha